jgi:hypothetical protein
MFFIIMAIVVMLTVMLAVMLTIMTRTVLVSVRKHQKQKREQAKIYAIRKERAARNGAFEALKAYVELVEKYCSGHKRHRKHKKYGIAYTCIDKYELPTLVGAKRLVDRDAETNCLTNLYDSDKWELGAKRSHTNVRNYKVNNRNARREKRAQKEKYYLSYEEIA